jgi:3-methylcrotonyl-CoA carboxylase alpha subunit
MNTRLQVEHPVTEMVTGFDLVEWQFRVAGGEKLPAAQDEIALSGHAVEARLYAEDPSRAFLPSTGKIHALRLPEGAGIRVDAGVEAGGEVTPYYDPMLGKIIAHDTTRAAALARLATALKETSVAGPRTNLTFLRALIASPAVQKGNVDTSYIERELATLAAPRSTDFAAAAHAVEELMRREQARIARRAKRRSDERRSPWDAADAFDFGQEREVEVPLLIDGAPAKARVRIGGQGARATVEGASAADAQLIDVPGGLIAVRDDNTSLIQLGGTVAVDLDHLDRGGVVRAPMHGKVLAVDVKAGDRVRKGQRLAVIEAMKMEHALNAHADGVVAEVAVEAGVQVAEGARMLVIAADAGDG